MNYYKSLTHKLNSLYHTRYRGRINRLARRTGNTLKAGMMSIGLFGFVVGTPGAALAANLPTGAQVVSGDVNINQLGNNAMRIVQGSQSAIVNWQSFDIGHGALVDVVQPNVDSAMLSRVIGNNLSEIHGSLNSNGNLYLINPNGILFGESAQVNVYSLIASTLDISDSDFLTGNIHFTGNSEESVINLGTINSESFTALIAGDVQNLGDIITPDGDVALLSGDAVIEVGEAAGGKITMDLSGLLGGSASNSGSIDVSSGDSTGGSVVMIGESVSNAGTIDASGATGGGEVLIGGDYQGDNPLLSNAQNTVVSGSISADAIENGDGGRVIVWADNTTDFSGSISVVGGVSSGNGGFVETSGKNILKFTGSVDATAENGETGDLLLDPIDITITAATTSGIQDTSSTWESDDSAGSSILNVSDLLTSLSSANVTISTQQNSSGQTAPAGGDITVSTAINNSGNNNNLTLVAGEDISIFFPITMGASGDLTLQAGQRSDINSGAVLATAALTANDLVVEADTGITIINSVVDAMNLTINQTGGVNVSNTQAFTLTANSNNNNITASTSSGNLSISSVNAGSGTVDLTASGGNILDSTPSDDSAVNITAASVSLAGSTGVGATGLGDIDTTASTLELSTTSSGNIFVADSDAVTLASSSTSSNGNIDVRTVSGDLTVSSAVTADGSGDIILNSAGALMVNNVLTSTSGDLSLTGATGVTHSAAGDLTTSGAGTITVASTANDVTMVDGTVFTAGGGSVSVTGADEVLLGKIANPLGPVSVTATAGDISDETSAEGTANENISGTTVTLSAATGVGSTGAANDIDTAATTIVAADSSSGGIYISETDGVAVGATSTTAGAISITAGGAVTTSGNITAAGGALAITGVNVTNTNTITGDANGISLNAGTGTLTSTAGNITNGGSAGAISLIADTDIVLAGGAGAITGGSGNVTLKDSAGSVTIAIGGGTGTITIADADLDEISTTGAIIIGDSNTGAIEVGGAVSIGSTALNLISSGGVTLSNTVSSGALTITNAGTLTIAAGGDISLSDAFTQNGAGAVSTAGDIVTTADNISFATAVTLTGAVALDSDGGNITFSSTVDGAQTLALDAAAGTIAFNGVVGATPLTSIVTTGTTGAINIGQNISTTGVQTFTGPVTLSGSPTLTSTDSLVTFSGDVSGAGALTVTTGTGGLTFGSTVGAGVDITSLSTSGTTGNITLTGNIDSDGTIDFNGPVLLAADSTITTSNDLVTFSNTLNNARNLVLTTGSGGVTFTGIVGGTPLTSLLTTGTTGTITLGNNINTTGAQNYVGPVSFNSDIALNITGGTDADDLSFASTVTATNDSLDINVASAGDVTFGDGSGTDTVAGINALTTNANIISVNTPVGATSIVFEGANTTGDQLTIASSGSLTATGLVTIGAANGTTEIEAISLSGNIRSDSDSSGSEALSILSNSAGGATVTFATSGLNLNAGTGSISASNAIFAAGGNSPSFLSDGGVSWNSLTASSGTLTLAPVTASTAINVAGSGGYAISDSTLDGIANQFTKVTIGNSSAGSVTIGASEALSLSKDWDLEIIGGASGSFVLGSANSVTLGSSQALILDSASVNITQTNELLGGGELLVKGSGDVTLTNASNNISRLAASNSGNLSYTDANDILVGTVDSVSDISVSGTVTLTATAGSINDAADDNTADFTAGGLISLTAQDEIGVLGSGSDLDLEFAAGSSVNVSTTGTGSADIDGLGAINLGALSIAQNLEVSSVGAITDSGVITVAGTTTFDTSAGNNAAIDLDSASTYTGNVTFTTDAGSDVTITDNSAFAIQSGLNVNNLSITSTGSVTDLGDINIDGTLSVSAVGQNIDLSGGGSNDITGAVTLTGAAVTLGDSTATSIAAITATGALSVTSGGAITQTGAIDGDSTASFTAGGNAITLANAGNDFGGAVSLSNSGTNAVSLRDTNALDLGTVGVGQDLTVTTGGTLTDSGAVTVAGLATIVSTGQSVTLGDSTTANFGSLDFAGSAVTITEASSMAIAASEATGALALVANGAITQSGAIDGDSTASFTAGGNAITLANAGNDFGGAVSLSNSGTNDVSLRDTNALDLGTVGVGQDLTVTTGGALTDSGAVTVAGLATIVSTGQSVTLGDSTTANFGSLDFAGSAVTITEASSMAIAASEATGALALVANGAITQSGAIDGDSTASFTAGGNAITLANAGNDFGGAVSLSNSGTNDVSLRDTNALDLGTVGVGQNLTVTTGGAIIDSGVITVAGTTTFDNSAGNNAAIDLDSASTYTGNVTFTTDAGSDVTITDNSAFAIQSGLNVNNLSITSTGSVTDLGDINIDGTLSVSAVGQNIDLSGGGSNDITGAVTLTGAAVTLGDSTATSIAAITATGALSVTSGGAITQTGAIDADSTASFTAAANAIILSNSGNDFSGAVSLSNSGSNNVSLTDTNVLDLGTVGVGQNLTLTTGGALTDSGAITVSGLATIISSGQAVTLGDSTTANFGSIDFTGGIVSITEASAMQVAASEATGSLTLVSSGAITQSGAIDADSTASFTAGGNAITLTNAGNDFSGAVSLSNSGSNDVSLADSNALDLGTVVVGQNLTLTSGEALTDSGVLNVAGNVGITTSANNGGVSLDQASDIDGTLSITTNGSGATSVTNLTGSIELGTITTAGLTIDARGITQSGVSTVSGASSFSASANAITLDQANEFSGAVSLSNSGANNVTIDDANDLVLGTVTIATGNLNVDNAGTITQTGVVSVGGNTVFDNSDGDNADITLANANNVFTGTATFTTDTGSDISITDTTAFDLGALSVNSLSVSAGGDISDSGVLDISTTATFTTTAANGNVVLDQASDIDGTLSLTTHGTGTTSVINLTDTIELGAVTSAGITIEADGAITQSAAATISGDASFSNTDATNAAITLNNASNSFGGSIALATDSGSAVTLTDTTAIELPALTVATLTLTSGGAVTDSGTLTVSGATSISASGQNITLDDSSSTFGSISLVGADVAVTENGDIDLGISTITGSASFNSSGNAISDSGTLAITGATTLNSGTGNITLDDTSSTLGDLTVTGGEVYLQDTGAITATINQASKVQFKAGTGLNVTSTGITEFAGESDSGNIAVVNTGGYAISDLSNITGVQFTNSEATGSISLVANSPLTINAPVSAGNGSLQLTASGSSSTDDVTINAAVSGGQIAVNAGDSIAVNSGGVTSTSLSLTASNDISVNTPIIATTANLNAGDQVSLESGASVSSSTFNVTSTKLKVDPSASVPAFNFSGGAEGDPSFDRNGRVQEATQNDWNSYFRASGTVELAYDSAGDVVLDQMILSFIENEAEPVNSGEVELKEEE